MTTTPDLETRLRAHYGAKAEELTLTPLEFRDVLAEDGRRTAVLTAPPAPAGRRGSAWMVAAALVAGATIGAGAILVTRDDDPTASAPTVVPTVESAAPSPIYSVCPGDGVPADVGDLDLPNDVRVPDALLPAATPDGHCVVDHSVSSTNFVGSVEYRVWSSCDSCERPTASVAAVRTQNDAASYEPLREPKRVEIRGAPALFYAPDDEVPVSRLYTQEGAAGHVAFVGWGLDESALIELANAVSSGATTIDGMDLVFEGYLDDFWPGGVPLESFLSVGYWTDAGGSWLSYGVSAYLEEQPPLRAFAWARPNPTFTTIDGHETVTFPASASFEGADATTVIIQIDDGTQVMLSSTGSPPLSTDELAAIELTPTPLDDPRWGELAWESGMYNGVG